MTVRFYYRISYLVDEAAASADQELESADSLFFSSFVSNLDRLHLKRSHNVNSIISHLLLLSVCL